MQTYTEIEQIQKNVQENQNKNAKSINFGYEMSAYPADEVEKQLNNFKTRLDNILNHMNKDEYYTARQDKKAESIKDFFKQIFLGLNVESLYKLLEINNFNTSIFIAKMDIPYDMKIYEHFKKLNIKPS